MIELRDQDFHDIAVGGTILGTGGGGSYAAAKLIAERYLARHRVQLFDLDDIPSKSQVAIAAGMGSPEAMLNHPFTTQARNALQALETVLPRPVDFVVPVESSGFNHLACMTACVGRRTGLVDADGAGRAIPRLGHTLLHVLGVPFSPFALANAPGRTVTVATSDFALEERLALNALEYFGWLAGLAGFPMTVDTVRKSSVPGMITLARRVGTTVRAARASGDDPLQAVLDVTGGTTLIRGKVVGFQAETDGSYTFGNLRVKGTGSYAGSLAAVRSMNENMIAWKDGQLMAVAPDRICYLKPGGEPITNADVSVGESIDVFVIEAQRQWRGEAALSAFTDTLRAMGFTGPYTRGALIARGRKRTSSA